MMKAGLAVVLGFVLWSFLWVGGNQVFQRVWPALFKPLENEQPVVLVLVSLLVFSVACSLASGALAALIAPKSMTSVWILGGILLIVGILVERSYWNLLPLWYHLSFLALLIPAVIFRFAVSLTKRLLLS